MNSNNTACPRRPLSALARAALATTGILAFTATAQAATHAATTAAVLSQPVAVKYRGAAASPALAKAFADSDEANLKLSPISAMVRGDNRFNGEFGDYITDPYIAATEAQDETDWRRLHEIDRASLSPEEQIAYDVFEYQTRLAIEGNTPALLAPQITRPLDHMNGLHVQYADISSGNSFAPYKTVKDYDNGLKRIDGFIVYLDRCIDRMREGMRTHVTQPKLVVRNLIGQLDDMLAQGIDKSPFYNPIVKMPADFSAADKTRLTAAYRAAVGKIGAEYSKLRKFLNDEYLPASRDSVGISAMPGGPTLTPIWSRRRPRPK